MIKHGSNVSPSPISPNLTHTNGDGIESFYSKGKTLTPELILIFFSIFNDETKAKHTNFPSKVCLMRSFAGLEEKLVRYPVPPLCSMIALTNL